MANNQNLKDAIAAVIKANGNNEITGAILQSSLLSIINQFGAGAIFAGVAEPSTVPINNDVVAFYIATTNGTYPNFGGYSLTNNDFVIFSNREGIYEAVAELNVSGINYLAPIEPGTIADRAELPTMKPNQKYTFEAKPGHYKFGSSVYNLTSDKRWLFFGDGTTWSLVDMGELPRNKIPEWVAGTYALGEQVIRFGVVYESVNSASSVDVPEKSPHIWKPVIYTASHPFISSNNLEISEAIIDAYIPDLDPAFVYFVERVYFNDPSYGNRIRILKRNKLTDVVSEHAYPTTIVPSLTDITVVNLPANGKIAIDYRKITSPFASASLELVFDESISEIRNTTYLFNSEVSKGLFSDLYNLSPTGLRFTLAEAIAAVPLSTRKIGLNITFLKAVGSWAQYRYTGVSLAGFADTLNWEVVEDADEKLLNDGLNKVGNTEEVLFDGEGNVSSVVYKDLSEVVIRTDSYQHGATEIIEEQSLPNGYKRAFLTDMNTLKTSRLDTSYKDSIQHPFSVINVSNGWQLTGGTSISGDKAILNSYPSTLRYRHNIEPFKNNTKYGLLLRVENNTLSRSLTLYNDFTGEYNVIASSGNNGYVKTIITSRPESILQSIIFQLQNTEAGSITVSEMRMFELNDDSLVKFDFENLSANQLNSKYPKQ